MPQLRPVSLTIVFVALAASGCVQVVMPGATGRNPTPPRAAPGQRPPAPGGQEPEVRRKRVTQKEPVSTLIARDGAWCTVSEERFRMIEVGDNVWCAWYGN